MISVLRAHAHVLRTVLALLATASVLAVAVAPAPGAAASTSYKRVSGSGSTWSANAIQQWVANVRQYGMTVDFSDTGSSVGRQQYANGTVDFAVSEIPFGMRDGASTEGVPTRKFAYMPIVAGGTSFMYNLTIGGKRVTALRLSGETLTKIFTGQITAWNDAAIQADNPGLRMPATRIVPVVRSDGSGTSAQFTAWMLARHPGAYQEFCAKVGRSPCTQTSNYPVPPGSSFVSKSGSNGVSGFVRQAQSEGSITYVEYSYAKNAGFPVAKVLNEAGYYTQPTAQNVAVGLLGAQIETDASNPATYLTQKLAGVYANPDQRAYPLSSYSYMILPVAEEGTFTRDKGKTLGDFAYYFLCAGQQQADVLGYSPLPINLVQAGLEQVRRIPGVDAQNVNVAGCNNPTFSSSGENTLAKNAPQPPACDKKSEYQCGTPAETVAGAGGASTATGGSGGGAAAGADGQVGGVGGPAGAPLDGAGVDGGLPTDQVLLDEFGEPIQGAAALAGRAQATALPIELAASTGWRRQHTLMLLTGLALLVLAVGPALVTRRLGGNR